MRHIKEGDYITACWTVGDKDETISGTVLHVPQDTGDLWYIDNDCSIIAFNPCSKSFDCIVKIKDKKEGE